MNFVLRTNPRHLAENVPLNKTIEIDLMVDLNHSQFREEHIILYHINEKRTVKTHCEYRNRTLKIKPLEEMIPNTHYQVKLVGGREGIQTLTGRFLEQSYLFEFYTKDIDQVKPPVITQPVHMTQVHSRPHITWNNAENAVEYEVQISKSNVFDLLEWPKEEVVIQSSPIIPMVEYENNATYYLRIRSVDKDGVKSAWSNNIQFHFYDQQKTPERKIDIEVEDKIVKFETKSTGVQSQEIDTLQSHFLQEEMNEVRKMYVERTSPSHQALNIPRGKISEIVITFSENIDPKTVDKNSIYLIAEKN